MPPPKFKKELTKTEINTIKTWIEEGAEWEGHWAFIPVKKSDEPKTEMPNWVRNPIDSFVLKTLKEKEMKPSPEADRRTSYAEYISILPGSHLHLNKLKILFWTTLQMHSKK